MQHKIILHLTCMRSTKYGGLEHYIVETSRQCTSLGFRTIVQYEEMPRSARFLADLRGIGVEVVVTKLAGGAAPSFIAVVRLLRSTRPEIVQTHFPNRVVLLTTALVAKLLGVRKTISMVFSMGHLSKRSIIWTRSYNLYDRVVCISNAIADNLKYAGVAESVVAVNYLGVFDHVERSESERHLLRKSMNVGEKDAVLGCIAFDTAFKGLDILLEAFAIIRREFSNVHLMLIGVDPLVSKLPELARSLGVSPQVHWMGIHDEGWRLLNAADIYVQPSRFAEGLSLATIEAMALKLPVVATRVAGPAELVLDGKTGHLCDPNDVGSLSTTLLKILRERQSWTKMGESGFCRFKTALRGKNSVEHLIRRYYL